MNSSTVLRSPSSREMREVQPNSQGVDFRALLGHWLTGVHHVEVHEPYLLEPWQREHLAFLRGVPSGLLASHSMRPP